jgi:hypothetical protein
MPLVPSVRHHRPKDAASPAAQSHAEVMRRVEDEIANWPDWRNEIVSVIPFIVGIDRIFAARHSVFQIRTSVSVTPARVREIVFAFLPLLDHGYDREFTVITPLGLNRWEVRRA